MPLPNNVLLPSNLLLPGNGRRVVSGPTLSGYNFVPSLADVGAILRTRTIDRNNNYLGTFTDVTNPDSITASNLTAQAVKDVAGEIGSNVPDELVGDAKTLAARRAAMLIELSVFTEQVNQGRSPYPQLERLYEVSLKSVRSAIKQIAQGGEPGPSDDQQMPVGDFPVLSDAQGQDQSLGWGTRW